MATPGAMAATMQFDQELERIQSDIDAMDGEQVNGLEISEVLLRMEMVLEGMSQQAGQVQTDDLESLYQAMSDLREVVLDYAVQAYELTGVGTTGTGTTTLPTPGTGGVTGTPTPGVGGPMTSPTPGMGGTTPGMMGTPTPGVGGGMMSPTPQP
jgi:hypothetical protein